MTGGTGRTGLGLLRLIRPHHWTKNLVVLAPLLLAPWRMSLEVALLCLAGTLVFCLLASAVYALNDLADADADRLHPVKSRRPIASGEVSGRTALLAALCLTAAALGWAAGLGHGFLAIALAYLALNLAYTFWAKRHAIIDVLFIATGFVLRVEAGALLIDVRPSTWIIVGTGLGAIFLGLAKRRDDLVQTLASDHRASLVGYNKAFLDAALIVMLSSGLVCYLMYVMDAAIAVRLGTDRLYLTVPFVIAAALRYLQVVYVFENSGSPVRTVLTDHFLHAAGIGWVAMFLWLVYG